MRVQDLFGREIEEQVTRPVLSPLWILPDFAKIETIFLAQVFPKNRDAERSVYNYTDILKSL